MLTVASIATHDRLDGRNGILGFIIVVEGGGVSKRFGAYRAYDCLRVSDSWGASRV